MSAIKDTRNRDAGGKLSTPDARGAHGYEERRETPQEEQERAHRAKCSHLSRGGRYKDAAAVVMHRARVEPPARKPTTFDGTSHSRGTSTATIPVAKLEPRVRKPTSSDGTWRSSGPSTAAIPDAKLEPPTGKPCSSEGPRHSRSHPTAAMPEAKMEPPTGKSTSSQRSWHSRGPLGAAVARVREELNMRESTSSDGGVGREKNIHKKNRKKKRSGQHKSREKEDKMREQLREGSQRDSHSDFDPPSTSESSLLSAKDVTNDSEDWEADVVAARFATVEDTGDNELSVSAATEVQEMVLHRKSEPSCGVTIIYDEYAPKESEDEATARLKNEEAADEFLDGPASVTLKGKRDENANHLDGTSSRHTEPLEQDTDRPVRIMNEIHPHCSSEQVNMKADPYQDGGSANYAVHDNVSEHRKGARNIRGPKEEASDTTEAKTECLDLASFQPKVMLRSQQRDLDESSYLQSLYAISQQLRAKKESLKRRLKDVRSQSDTGDVSVQQGVKEERVDDFEGGERYDGQGIQHPEGHQFIGQHQDPDGYQHTQKHQHSDEQTGVCDDSSEDQRPSDAEEWFKRTLVDLNGESNAPMSSGSVASVSSGSVDPASSGSVAPVRTAERSPRPRSLFPLDFRADPGLADVFYQSQDDITQVGILPDIEQACTLEGPSLSSVIPIPLTCGPAPRGRVYAAHSLGHGTECSAVAVPGESKREDWGHPPATGLDTWTEGGHHRSFNSHAQFNSTAPGSLHHSLPLSSYGHTTPDHNRIQRLRHPTNGLADDEETQSGWCRPATHRRRASGTPSLDTEVGSSGSESRRRREYESAGRGAVAGHEEGSSDYLELVRPSSPKQHGATASTSPAGHGRGALCPSFPPNTTPGAAAASSFVPRAFRRSQPLKRADPSLVRRIPSLAGRDSSVSRGPTLESFCETPPNRSGSGGSIATVRQCHSAPAAPGKPGFRVKYIPPHMRGGASATPAAPPSGSANNLGDDVFVAYRRRMSAAHSTPYDPAALVSRELPVGFLDSHCHLDFLFRRDTTRRDCSTLAEYRREVDATFPISFAGCIAVFCEPGFWLQEARWGRMLTDENVWAAFGCHPHNVHAWSVLTEGKLKEICSKHKRVMALGEIGLDYSANNCSDHHLQRQVFRRQIALGLSFGLPLVLHVRDAEQDALDIAMEMIPRDYLIHRHCITGNLPMVRRWMETFTNCYVGFTPIICNPRAGEARAVAASVNLDRVLLETDAPYFLPHCYKTSDQSELPANQQLRYSHPGLALHVAAQLAHMHRVPLEEVVRITAQNTRTMYRLPPESATGPTVTVKKEVTVLEDSEE